MHVIRISACYMGLCFTKGLLNKSALSCMLNNGYKKHIQEFSALHNYMVCALSIPISSMISVQPLQHQSSIYGVFCCDTTGIPAGPIACFYFLWHHRTRRWPWTFRWVPLAGWRRWAEPPVEGRTHTAWTSPARSDTASWSWPPLWIYVHSGSVQLDLTSRLGLNHYV